MIAARGNCFHFRFDSGENLSENVRNCACYNEALPRRRYRLGVRTEDSQSSNPGSIPGSATILLNLPLS